MTLNFSNVSAANAAVLGVSSVQERLQTVLQ